MTQKVKYKFRPDTGDTHAKVKFACFLLHYPTVATRLSPSYVS